MVKSFDQMSQEEKLAWITEYVRARDERRDIRSRQQRKLRESKVAPSGANYAVLLVPGGTSYESWDIELLTRANTMNEAIGFIEGMASYYTDGTEFMVKFCPESLGNDYCRRNKQYLASFVVHKGQLKRTWGSKGEKGLWGSMRFWPNKEEERLSLLESSNRRLPGEKFELTDKKRTLEWTLKNHLMDATSKLEDPELGMGLVLGNPGADVESFLRDIGAEANLGEIGNLKEKLAKVELDIEKVNRELEEREELGK